MEALANLGIDWKLLLAQVVNFVVVLLVLRRFAYQPMLRLLDERTHKIEKGLADAESATRKLGEMETKEKAVWLMPGWKRSVSWLTPVRRPRNAMP